MSLKEPEYIKLYIQTIDTLNLTSSMLNVLMALLRRAKPADDPECGMCVILVSHYKRQICNEVGLPNISSLDNILHKLTSTGLIIRIATGVYQINPFIFGKGDWKDISKLRGKIKNKIQ